MQRTLAELEAGGFVAGGDLVVVVSDIRPPAPPPSSPLAAGRSGGVGGGGGVEGGVVGGAVAPSGAARRGDVVHIRSVQVRIVQ